MSTPPPIPPSAPSKIFFQGVRTYRNGRAFTMMANSAILGGPIAYNVYLHLTHQKEGPMPFFFPIIAAIFLLPLLVLGINCLRNVREPIEISEQGIRSKHNFWYWTQVKSLKPKKLEFKSAYYIRVGLNVDPRQCLLMPDGGIPAAGYAELVDGLKIFLAQTQPAVQIEELSK